VNEIEPNEHGDDWLFEIAFDRGDVARYETGELELVEVLGLEHEAEIMLALDTSSANAAVVGAEVTRLSAETFVVVAATLRVDDERVVVELQPRDHPRDALRVLMRRFGAGWLVEDDGWYANVTWGGERFPIAGVDAAQIFLRPWRDPRPGEPLPGEPAD
jgi:hypothetical protein